MQDEKKPKGRTQDRWPSHLDTPTQDLFAADLRRDSHIPDRSADKKNISTNIVELVKSLETEVLLAQAKCAELVKRLKSMRRPVAKLMNRLIPLLCPSPKPLMIMRRCAHTFHS